MSMKEALYSKNPSHSITYLELCEEMEEDPFADLAEWADNPNLLQNKDKLVELFHLMYDCKEIGQSTPGQFYRYLRIKYNDVALRYETLLALYEANKASLLVPGSKTTRVYNELNQGNDTNTSTIDNTDTNSQYDTPKTNLPNALTFPSVINTNVTDGDNQNILDSSHNRGITETVTSIDTDTVEKLNAIGEKYKDIIFDFVYEFGDLFLTIYILEG